jgi:fructoselysine 3-epimerase
MKLSVSTFVYLNYPLEEALARIRHAGYEGVDIWGGRPHAYRNDMSEARLEMLRRQLADSGLAVASFIPAQFRYPTCLCSPLDEVRQDSVAYIRAGIGTAARLGAPVVSVCPGRSLFGQSRTDAFARLSRSLSDLSLAAEAEGVRLALEPADRFETDLINTCSQALDFISGLGRPNIGVVLDTGHSHVVGESIPEVVRKLGDRLFHVHIDDNLGLRDQHLVPGEGTFDFLSLIAALKTAGYDGYLGAELSWDYTLEPDQAVQLSRERVKGYLDACEAGQSGAIA